MKKYYWIILIFIFLFSSSIEARIKLSALPERGTTIVRLDNFNATLIEEDRNLTLQKGINKVDFSWKGVSIDMDSIRLSILSNSDKVNLLNAAYPPHEKALVWNIHSQDALEVLVRLSYVLQDFDHITTYKLIVNENETNARLQNYFILRNFSGENFHQAKIWSGYENTFETHIRHEETKQIESNNIPNIPIKKIWKWDSELQKWDPEKEKDNIGIPLYYRLKNTSENNFEKGKIRVFQKDKNKSTLFIGEDRLENIAVNDEMDIYIGDSRDIVVTQHKMKERKVNIRNNVDNRIILFDVDEQITAKIENFKDSKAMLSMTQHIPGQWDMEKCNYDYTLKDSSTLLFEIEMEPQSKVELVLNYYRRNIQP